MIRRTFGAPLGGTMRAGQKGLEPLVVRSILPPNFCGGAGIWSPWIVVVALGEPGVPVICCGTPEVAPMRQVASTATTVIAIRDILTSLPPLLFGLVCR